MNATARLPFTAPALVLAAMLALAAAPAAASLIQLQTRHSTAAAPSFAGAAQNGEYYRDTVSAAAAAAATAGHCDTTLTSLVNVSNQSACGGGNSNIAFLYTVAFGLSAQQAGQFSLQVGPDFGRGGAVYLDGNLLAVRTDDLWWSGNYGNSGEIFSLTNLPLGSGNHLLAIYGLEGCCDGQQSARFQINGGSWMSFASTDGLNPQNTVPEPGSAALVLGALALAGGLSRRRPRALPQG